MSRCRYVETALIIGGITSALASATTATTTAIAAHKQDKAQSKALDEQRKAQAKAEAEATKANESAEKQRLEALAGSQTGTQYANAWGVDESLAAKYANNAADVSKAIDEEEENNPFYTRGLL